MTKNWSKLIEKLTLISRFQGEKYFYYHIDKICVVFYITI